MEIWKDIPGLNNYQVSNFGRVKSISRRIFFGKNNSTTKITKEKILVLGIDKDGYLQANTSKHPKGITRKVHRLVMLAFNGYSDLDVNHIDGDKSNNHIDNLEYLTKSENHLHARHVLGKLIGENHWTRKKQA